MTDFIIYTDGSCLSNPGGKGAWAYLIYDNIGFIASKSIGYLKTTNNRMEMMAIINAIESCPLKSRLLIYSDSMYAINSFSIWLDSWKRSNFKNGTVKNLDLIHKYVHVTKERFVSFKFVRGHNGDLHNETCDKMANAKAESGPWIQDEIFEWSGKNLSKKLKKR